ncbi:MAG: hypothetical protein KJ666_00875 [Bacteroidetes bacterium]|nr:hypothetical protein [Bacteroidota bacterium]MBU2585872.1 hypothetical protein [Bacteroidota bacterium]
MKINRRKFIALGLLGGAFTLLKGFSNNLFAKKIHADGPKESPFKPSPQDWNDDDVSICWIGHSSFLINFYGTIFLKDVNPSTKRSNG